MTRRFAGIGWHALSVRQPWAWAIVNGQKPIENREWRTPYRGPLVIHAGRTLGCVRGGFEFECLEVAAHAKLGGLMPDCERDVGGFVGMAQLVDCVTRDSREWRECEWFSGPYGLVLEKAESWPLIAWPGERRIWPLGIEVESYICERLEALGRI